MAASNSHFKSADGQTQKQPKLSVNGKEAQGECSVTVEESGDFNPFRSSSVVSIYRVPDILMSDRVKREAYVPTRVSLGPYHHETEKLRSMDSHKERALQRMMIRFNNLANDFSLCATEEIVKIRNIYEEKINCDEEKIARMLTLDGCFILEILRTLNGVTLPEDGNCYEPLFVKKKILYTGMDILNDMLKLENQIPFIVLLKLLKLELNSMDIVAKMEVFQMMRPTFLPLFYPFRNDELEWSRPQADDEEIHHLLDWLRRFIVSPHGERRDIAHSQNGEHASNAYTTFHLLGSLSRFIVSPHGERRDIAHAGNAYVSVPRQDEERAKDNAKADIAHYCNLPDQGSAKRNAKGHVCDHIHRAIELENAGIKFERFDGGIANIKYDKSRNTICLPRITIKDSTEILFRNLIAFEMCKPSHPFNYVACYVRLMDQLIDSAEDVALLRKRKIITNHLGSDEEVAKLFNGLCKGVNVNLQGAFDGLTEKVHNHYNNKFRVQLAELVKEYFSSPWKTLGLLGGIALLLLSIVQTVVAILALYK